MRHILLVDDEPEVLEGLCYILEPLNDVTLHTATLASQALQLMAQLPISLVVADIRMPGMNGIDMWEQIRLRRPSCRVIFLSGVRDFDNIYRVIQNPSARFLTKLEPEEKILATVEEVLSEVAEQEQQQAHMQQRHLLALLEGSEAESSQALRHLRESSMPIDPAQGMICAFFAVTNSWSRSKAKNQQVLNRLSVDLESLHTALPSCFVRLTDSQAIYLVQASPDLSDDAYLAALTKLCTSELPFPISCIYTVTLHTFEELAADYRSLTDNNLLTSLAPASVQSLSSIQADPQQQRMSDTMQKFRFHTQVLRGYIKLGQKDSFRTSITAILDELDSQFQSAGQYIYFGVLDLLYQALETSSNTELRSRIRSEHSAAAQADATPPQRKARLLDFADQTFDTLFPINPYARPDVISGIMNYIRDHLEQDLSLNALSTRFNISPNYLSRTFRESTGYKLHEYITQLRLGTAERLLLTSNLRIHEIARRAGYDSSHTFIRAFKKQYGHTPAEHRSNG